MHETPSANRLRIAFFGPRNAGKYALERRKELGMTQRELADKMDVSPVYVGKLLKGNENLTLETICKIESVLGEKLLSVVKPYEKAQIIQLAQPYQASPDVEFSPVYSKSIKAKNRNQHSNLRLCAYC